MHVAAQAVELCHNDRGLQLLRCFQRRGKLRPPIERIGTFSGFNLLERLNEIKPLSLGEPSERGMANNFMLMTLFSIVADMAENSETDVKRALLDLTDDYNLPGIPPDTAKEARDTAKQIINGILAGGKPLKRH
jgi:hypothetical protein